MHRDRRQSHSAALLNIQRDEVDPESILERFTQITVRNPTIDTSTDFSWRSCQAARVPGSLNLPLGDRRGQRKPLHVIATPNQGDF